MYYPETYFSIFWGVASCGRSVLSRVQSSDWRFLPYTHNCKYTHITSYPFYEINLRWCKPRSDQYEIRMGFPPLPLQPLKAWSEKWQSKTLAKEAGDEAGDEADGYPRSMHSTRRKNGVNPLFFYQRSIDVNCVSGRPGLFRLTKTRPETVRTSLLNLTGKAQGLQGLQGRPMAVSTGFVGATVRWRRCASSGSSWCSERLVCCAEGPVTWCAN